jgi:hypothetical protein
MHEIKVGQAVSFSANFPERASTARCGHRRRQCRHAPVEVLVDFADAAKAPRTAGLYAEGRIDANGVVRDTGRCLDPC